MADIIDNLSFVSGFNLNDQRFTDDEIKAAEALLAGFISARQPTLDLAPGTTLYDLVVRPAAIVYLTDRAQVKASTATRSIKGIQENPTLASDSVLDAILSNFRITRKSGSKA